jgi:hypothetical protein
MRHLRLCVVVLALALAGAGACKPDLGSPPSLITAPRILAVRGMPAEAGPNKPVTYDVLAVDPTGRIASPGLTWATCATPRPPASANAVANKCLTEPDIASGPTFTAMVPPDACKVFGPQPPKPVDGLPPVRPQDPDFTGGFYVPVRAALNAGGEVSLAFALERLTCPLSNAPVDIAGMFNEMVKPNQNPVISSLTLSPRDAPTALYANGQAAAPAPATVEPGATVTFEAAWNDAAPETYPVFNLVTGTLDTHRESLSVSWFATDGSFQHDRTGRGETEPELTTDNDWTAPETPGIVHFWVLLRDVRGGVDFAEAAIMVGP